MEWLDRLPSLPAWVPFPQVVWFVVEGVLLAAVGLLVRNALGPSVGGLVIVGNIVMLVGSLTALFGALAWLVLYAANR
jgi:hypothetical protein